MPALLINQASLFLSCLLKALLDLTDVIHFITNLVFLFLLSFLTLCKNLCVYIIASGIDFSLDVTSSSLICWKYYSFMKFVVRVPRRHQPWQTSWVSYLHFFLELSHVWSIETHMFWLGVRIGCVELRSFWRWDGKDAISILWSSASYRIPWREKSIFVARFDGHYVAQSISHGRINGVLILFSGSFA